MEMIIEKKCPSCKSIHTGDTKCCETCKSMAKARYNLKKKEILQKAKEERIKNPTKYKNKHAEYYQENKDEILMKANKHYQENKNKINIKKAEYYQENKDEVKLQRAIYYQENKEGILIKKAEYYQENKDEICEEQNRYYNTRIGKLKKIYDSTLQSGHIITMSDEEIMDMTDMPCVYCEHETEDGIFRNGIDRLDSSIGYEITNCVPCCWTCNRSKGQVDPLTFVDRAKQISMHNGGEGTITTSWSIVFSMSFTDYRNQVLKNNKIFELSKEEFEDLRAKKCNYCGRSTTSDHSNGIDCFDPDPMIGYIISNCTPACRDCNFMKNIMKYDKFIAHMKKIASCKNIFPDIPRKFTTFSNKK